MTIEPSRGIRRGLPLALAGAASPALLSRLRALLVGGRWSAAR